MASFRQQSAGMQSRHRQQGWLGFFVGLALGLFVAVLVYLQGGGVRPSTVTTTSVQPTESPGSNASPPQPTVAPVAKPPRFDFYTILPESEVKVGEPESTKPRSPRAAGAVDPKESAKQESADEPAAATKERSATGAAQFSLQVGSFQRKEDAERVKAKLVLIGLSADIHSVMVNGNEPWFRVMAGPYGDTARLQAARRRLEENNLSYMIVKLKN
jgi:cell division protein FtsN